MAATAMAAMVAMAALVLFHRHIIFTGVKGQSLAPVQTAPSVPRRPTSLLWLHVTISFCSTILGAPLAFFPKVTPLLLISPIFVR